MRRSGVAHRVLVVVLFLAWLSRSWACAGEMEAEPAGLIKTARTAQEQQERVSALWELRSYLTGEAMAAVTDAAERDPSFRVRSVALGVMREMADKRLDLIGERQIALLEKILDQPEGVPGPLREEAVSAYRHARGKAAIPKFLSVLEKEKSPTIRFRLLFQGDGFWDALKESPEVLCRTAVEDPDARVAEQAARALTDIADARALDALSAYIKKVPENGNGVLSLLGRRRKLSHEALERFLEPRLKEFPLGVLHALQGASDPRHETVQPILADLALKVLPLLPPGEKYNAFRLIGNTGSLRHLAVLNDGDNPARLRELYGPIAEDTLGRFRDDKSNGMDSILHRNPPRNVRAFVPDKKDAKARAEFVANFQRFWTRYYREEHLSEVLAALTPEELEQAILPMAPRLASQGIEELLEPLVKSRPAESGRLLPRMFERFFDAGGKGSIQFRYALSYLAATERREAADLLFREWQKARAAAAKDAAWEDTLLNALLAFKTSAAEDVTLKLLDVSDRRRYAVIQQLGRIGTRKAHQELSAILAREPDTELRGGDIVEYSHNILRRALADIEKRIGDKGAPQPK